MKYQTDILVLMLIPALALECSWHVLQTVKRSSEATVLPSYLSNMPLCYFQGHVIQDSDCIPTSSELKVISVGKWVLFSKPFFLNFQIFVDTSTVEPF